MAKTIFIVRSEKKELEEIFAFFQAQNIPFEFYREGKIPPYHTPQYKSNTFSVLSDNIPKGILSSEHIPHFSNVFSKKSLQEKAIFLIKKWNDILSKKYGLPKVVTYDGIRKSHLNSRLKENPHLEHWKKLYSAISKSTHLHKESWFNFDFVIKSPLQAEKIMSGWMNWKKEKISQTSFELNQNDVPKFIKSERAERQRVNFYNTLGEDIPKNQIMWLHCDIYNYCQRFSEEAKQVAISPSESLRMYTSYLLKNQWRLKHFKGIKSLASESFTFKDFIHSIERTYKKDLLTWK